MALPKEKTEGKEGQPPKIFLTMHLPEKHRPKEASYTADLTEKGVITSIYRDRIDQTLLGKLLGVRVTRTVELVGVNHREG